MKLLFALFTGFLVWMGSVARAADTGAPANQGASPWVAIARGRVEPLGGIVRLAANRDGIVKEMLATEGEHVKLGAALATLDDTAARLRLAVAQKELAQAQAALASLQIHRTAADREVRRLEQLVAEQLANTKDLDQARDRSGETQAEIGQASAVENVANARVAMAQYEVDSSVVRAPMDGLIVRRFSRPGEAINPLSVTPLFWLAPDGPRVVVAEFDEDAISHLAMGQRAEVVTESMPSRTVDATLQKVGLIFGPKRPATDDPAERQDVRVVECVFGLADTTPQFLFGQRVLVRVLRIPPKSR